MKKYISILLILVANYSIHSQSISDALLYANDNLSGTARFRSMSGAFGALGGDFSSINVNPAGSAVFLNNQVSFTLTNFNIRNKSNYFGTEVVTENNAFDINQAGGILVFDNHNSSSDWKKIVLAVNYENTSNLDNSLDTFGTNPTNSIADYFLSYANPELYNSTIPISILSDPNTYYEDLDIRNQQAYLGFQGYVINADPNNSSNDTYVSNVPAGYFYQENYTDSRGLNGKVSINFASQYKDKFYFGLNLNSHLTDYTKTTSFYEENDNSTTSGLKRLLFENYQNTYGNGFSFQFGAIAKVTEKLRTGLSYESPTWYRLTDEKQQLLQTTGYKYGNPPNPDLSSQMVDSNFLLIYPEYKLQTPSKWTGSLAYVFGKQGLISVDYSLKDYSKTRFKPNDSFFRPLNARIDAQLHAASEFRIGGEYRIKQWSLRGGYRYEESPYKDKKVVGDLSGFSTGFGYNFGTTRLDMAYAYSQRKSQQGFFSQGFTDGPEVMTKSNTISLTLVFEM
ncbi:MAG: outer membrane protein transport protein [Flavobacterium sp.]|nr:outer membrane protein transport protein [Flavobacterium sp.]